MNLKSIIEVLLFAAHKPLSPQEIRSVLTTEPEEKTALTAIIPKKIKEAEIAAAIEELRVDYIQTGRSFTIGEVAGGFQLVSRPEFAPWLKLFLDVERPNRLSPSALETLAICAYRQPITRVEIESVRGVNVDGVLRTLLERGLVKITGRSDLPGRPLQYGTTQSFLEHFGLRTLDELPAIEELRRIEAKRQQEAAVVAPVSVAPGGAVATAAAPETPAGEKTAELPLAETTPPAEPTAESNPPAEQPAESEESPKPDAEPPSEETAS